MNSIKKSSKERGQMKSVERVIRTLQYKETDRVPFGMFATTDKYELRYAKEIGLNTREELYDFLEIDLWDIWYPLTYIGEKRFYQGKEADCWGVPLESYLEGNLGNLLPLSEISSLDEVEQYSWPKVDDFCDAGFLDEIESHQDYAIVAGVWAPIFHNLIWLCGFENALMNMIKEPEISHALIKKITDFWVAYTKKTLEAGKGKIHIVQNCNDFGAHDSMLISPDTFREFFMQPLQKLYNTIKNYDAKVMQYSYGAINPIIPDLIEMGADILNPIHTSATGMEFCSLVEQYGGEIVFYGGVDTKNMLPTGSKEKIVENVAKNINLMIPYGGYILSGSQGLVPEISIHSVNTMFEAGKLVVY
jgi:uroporphyrinogen decarboxylase